MVGLRYTRARRRNRFIGVNSAVSMIGIAVGVWALIVVLSVMNGFQKEVRTRILGVVSHLQILAEDNRLADWQSVAKIAAQHPRVVATAPFVQAQAMLSNGQSMRGAVVRGILPGEEEKVADLAQHMRAGSLDALRAGRVRRGAGRRPRARARRAARRQDRADRAAGHRDAGGRDPAPEAVHRGRRVRGRPGRTPTPASRWCTCRTRRRSTRWARRSAACASSSTTSSPRAPWRDELLAKLPPNVFASDWTRSHANFFRAVEIEKRMMFLILGLIVLVAAINIISTLVMAVTDKQADIAILRTLGAAPRSILQIFMVQGMVIGVVGTLAGVRRRHRHRAQHRRDRAGDRARASASSSCRRTST